MSESDDIQDAVEKETKDADAKLGRTMRQGRLPVPYISEPVSIEVKNLVVGQQPRRQIALGEPEGLVRAVGNLGKEVQGIIWNEDRLHLVLKGGDELRFEPEMIPTAGIFFRRKPRSRYEDSDDKHQGPIVWEGDYEAVQFTKRAFVRFLKENAAAFDAEFRDAVKELKVSQVTTVRQEMMDDDSDNERTMREDAKFTNVPKRFSMTLPLAEGWTARLDFETDTVQLEGHGRGTMGVELTCVNARQVRREMMESILARLPETIPRYYGAMKVLG